MTASPKLADAGGPVAAVERVLLQRVITCRGSTEQLAWDVVEVVRRHMAVDTTDARDALTRLIAAVDVYLAIEYPTGTGHPADRTAAALRSAVDAARRHAKDQP